MYTGKIFKNSEITLNGASDICKTNFIHVAGAGSGLMYQDSVKVEFYKED